MNILSIDTAEQILTVVVDNGKQLFCKSSDGDLKKHNALLIKYIDETLEQANLSLEDIDYFAAVVGPGSFTGVRVGTATLNAFATALNKKLISLTSFECVESDLQDRTVLVEAGHGSYYYGTFCDDKICEKGYCEGVLKVDNIIIKDKTVADCLAAKARLKAQAGEFKDMLEPLYLRKSQAERIADGE